MAPGRRGRRVSLRRTEPADRGGDDPGSSRHDLRPQRLRSSRLSEDAASVFATPYQIENAPKAAAQLANVLDTDESKILELISNRESGLRVPGSQGRSFDRRRGRRARSSRRRPAAGLAAAIYPEGELASQVIGAVGIDNQGLTGLEAAEDETLGGDDGERIVTRDALGAELERSTTDPSSAGSDLTLTIDASIQATTERVIQDIGETSRPLGATAIVMDPQTSEILAMANWPRVDPYNLDEAESEDLINMATSFTYEPGSTFKAFTVGASMEEGLVTPNTTFDLPPIAPGRRPADRGVPPARLRDDERGRHSRAVLERRSGDDRHAAERQARRTTPSTRGSGSSASASRPASTSPARSRASCSLPRSTPARAWATCRSARASRSPRSRSRTPMPRSPTAGILQHAAARALRERPAGRAP